MESQYQLGLDLIAALQALTWLDAPMRFFTFLGTKEFFIFVLPALYWCLDARLGIRVAFLLLVGTLFNEMLKLAFQGPRPYWISSDILALSAESTFGIPSGHAQTAAALWGMLAVALRRRWAPIAALTVIFLIGLSRIYLGVHFLRDVALGWLLGALTLWAFVVAWGVASHWFQHRTPALQVMLACVLPVLLMLPAAALVNSLSSYQFPDDWMINAMRAGEPYPDPVNLDSTITPAAGLFGFSLGLVLMQRVGGFVPSGPVWKRILSFVVGLIGVAGLYVGLKLLFPDGESLLGGATRFFRYAVLGLWAGAGAPLTFRWLRLNQRRATN